MKIAYTSNNKIYSTDFQGVTEIPCERINKYKNILDDIRRRNEWKTTGRGAQFTGTAMSYDERLEVPATVSGLGDIGGQLIYSVILDESGGMYSRSYDASDTDEGLILSGRSMYFGSFDCYNGKNAVSMGSSPSSLHIAGITPPSAVYTEYTDGDTTEEFPSWSRTKNGIYFSTAGYARNRHGSIAATSPRAGAFLNLDTNTMEEILTNPEYDYLRLKEGADGSLYYIRQNYRESKGVGNAIKDFILFPYRIIQGLFGWLNFMCMMWGGESLKSGDNPDDMLKSRNRSKKDVIIEGNVIKADKIAKVESRKGEAIALMPLSRVLIKRTADGSEEIIARGVLDYMLCSDGSIAVSDGGRIIVIDSSGKTVCSKRARFAMNLTECT